jgi:hypothetical protein
MQPIDFLSRFNGEGLCVSSSKCSVTVRAAQLRKIPVKEFLLLGNLNLCLWAGERGRDGNEVKKGDRLFACVARVIKDSLKEFICNYTVGSHCAEN